MKLKHKFKFVIGIFVLLVSYHSYAAGTFVYCSDASPKSLNPHIVTDSTSFDASAIPIYNRLVELNSDSYDIMPSLAEAWQVSADGMRYTFYLRDDVKWHSNHDFRPTRHFNADDVIFSFMRQIDVHNPYYAISDRQFPGFNYTGLNRIIKEIEKIDGHTVVVHLTEPSANFLVAMTMPFASILSAQYAEMMLKAGTPEKMDTHPIGTGPFSYVHYQKDSRILYRVNNSYFGQKAKFDRLVFIIIPDPTIRYAKLQKGECHAMAYPNVDDVKRAQQDSRLEVQHIASINPRFIAFNLDHAPLDNIAIRQALNLSVNKQAIVDSILQDSVKTASGISVAGIPSQYIDEIDDLYDPLRAETLLKKEGDDHNLSIQLAIPKNLDQDGLNMVSRIQSDWENIGIRTQRVTFEPDSILTERADAMLFYPQKSDNAFNLTMRDCQRANMPFSYWCEPYYVNLLQKIQREMDKQRRIEYYQEFQQAVQQHLPLLPLVDLQYYVILRKEIKGYMIESAGIHNFNHVSIEK